MQQSRVPPAIQAVFREFAYRRASVTHTCATCGKAFTGLRQARYCSNACRQRGFKQRQREQRRDGAGSAAS